jgi:hypothetical protein
MAMGTRVGLHASTWVAKRGENLRSLREFWNHGDKREWCESDKAWPNNAMHLTVNSRLCRLLPTGYRGVRELESPRRCKTIDHVHYRTDSHSSDQGAGNGAPALTKALG